MGLSLTATVEQLVLMVYVDALRGTAPSAFFCAGAAWLLPRHEDVVCCWARTMEQAVSLRGLSEEMGT